MIEPPFIIPIPSQPESIELSKTRQTTNKYHFLRTPSIRPHIVLEI